MYFIIHWTELQQIRCMKCLSNINNADYSILHCKWHFGISFFTISMTAVMQYLFNENILNSMHKFLKWTMLIHFYYAFFNKWRFDNLFFTVFMTAIIPHLLNKIAWNFNFLSYLNEGRVLLLEKGHFWNS